ncbi:hypothetical protein DSO57_1035816 [Entomophthora muscae]|uniref:Uncharacterized protein n=1 Tax=Entomophthora muscae TaxID=34485 RepID=A0ACC2RE80_9FUNG|nr:hypothetical protein DSO57_1035816 [Entomophthora muscae]
MTTRGKEFIGREFKRLFQNWYQPKNGLTPAEVMVYEGNAFVIIGKILEDFAVMQSKYFTLPKEAPHLENDNLIVTIHMFGGLQAELMLQLNQ